MKNFEIIFSMYDKEALSRINTPPQHLSADDFAAAYAMAGAMLKGMQMADPYNEYRINSIVNQSSGGVSSNLVFKPFEFGEEK